MIRTRSLGLLGGIFLALVCPAFAAEEAAPPSTPRAVVIGIADYADKQIKPRKHAEDDAKALYDLLTSKDTLGIEPGNIRLLLGKEDEKRKSRPATRQNILEAAEWLAAESKSSDVAYFVFIGEGGPLGEKSDRRCYFASDSVFKDRAKTAVAAADFEDRFKKLKSRKFVSFVDIDFKGFNDKSVLDPSLGSTPYREFLGEDESEEKNFLPGRTIFLATNGMSTSLDLKEHGLLTHVLLAALKGEADKDGYEPDGVVTVNELTAYMNKELPRLAKEHGKTDAEKDQHHFILGDRASETALTTNPAAIAKVRKRLEKLEQLITEKKLPEKMVDEARRLLSQMPRLKAQQELRKEFQAYLDGGIDLKKLEERREAILASTKLDRDPAEKFAKKVLEGSQVLLEEYVKKVEQGELVNWAIRGLYRRVNESLTPELREKLAKAKKMNEAELRDLLIEARLHLGKREDLDGQKDVDIALQRMLANLDPYTTYIDPQTLEQFKKQTEGKFVGIGVSIRKDPATDYLLVITPLKGSPAYRAGMRAGDFITSVTLEMDRVGKPLDKPEVVLMKGLSVNDAVKKITGKPGTKVKVTVQRTGEEKPREYEIVREQIEMETVVGVRRKANDDWDYLVDPVTKIGYVRLSQFTRTSGREMALAVAQMKKDGIKGLVLDLRFNPGGLLTTAREITDMFVDDGLIVSIRPREGREEKLPGFSEGSSLGFPMACLINGGSASGSEIVSAALQDHGRAVIVGERSYGKGSVQNVLPFAGGEMKLTTASFWRPSGKNLNKSSTKGTEDDVWGVSPDKGFEVKLSARETDDLEEAQKESEVIHPPGTPAKKPMTEFKDRQLDKALDYLRTQIKLADKVKSAKKADDE